MRPFLVLATVASLLLAILWIPAAFRVEAAVILHAKAKQAPGHRIHLHTSPLRLQFREPMTLGRKNSIETVKWRPLPVPSYQGYQPNIWKQISSKSAIILDAHTGKPLFAKQPDIPRQPASTIKVLTGMIALKSLKKQTPVRASRYACSMPRSKVYLDPQKTYSTDDLINAVLLASANDASVALAEKIAGSEQAFARMMTLRARLWGARNTLCRTATGLTARGQHSTARDLATIFRHAMRDPEFVRRMHRTIVSTSFGQRLHNHNKALWRIKGAVGGKTGYTAAARQTYVGQFTRGKDSIIVAIMGSETMWSDIKKLVDYGFARKKQIRVASQGNHRVARQYD